MTRGFHVQIGSYRKNTKKVVKICKDIKPSNRSANKVAKSQQKHAPTQTTSPFRRDHSILHLLHHKWGSRLPWMNCARLTNDMGAPQSVIQWKTYFQKTHEISHKTSECRFCVQNSNATTTNKCVYDVYRHFHTCMQNCLNTPKSAY